MRKKIFSKIAVKLILLISVAVLVSIIVFIVIGNALMYKLLEHSSKMTGTGFVYVFNVYSITTVIAPIITFVIIFIIGVNRRVRYLKHITNRVMAIKDTSYLEQIEVKGNDEISKLVQSINIMSDRLKDNYTKEKKVEEAKNELIIAVSHDLKTPLTSIIGYLELLKNKFPYDEEQREYLQVAYGNSLNLKKLIDELFEYTKLTNDYVELKKVPFNMAILINQIIGEHALFFSNKGIKVEIESDSQELYCDIDVEKIIRVMDNIINNAEKYSYPNTVFKIYMYKLKDSIKISFENTGESIKEEDLEKIFEKMYRLDKARALKNEGSGLGLAISKKIIELHGGHIWAECKGNTIKISILLNR